jgi:IclR family mhp operon transcriptional activator
VESPRKPRYPPIASVTKAIDLLLAMNRQPVSTVDSLHRDTGMPKPTVFRLLETLIAKGLVRRTAGRGSYTLSGLVRALSSGYHSAPRIISACEQSVMALTHAIKWPASVALFEVDAMVIRFGTHAHSPLARAHSLMNARYGMLTSAVGLAYTAFCSPQECEAILAQCRSSADPRERELARHSSEAQAVLEICRRNGYASWHFEDRKVRAIAVPILDGHAVAATISVTWFRASMAPQTAVERYLQPLRDTAAEVSRILASDA